MSATEVRDEVSAWTLAAAVASHGLPGVERTTPVIVDHQHVDAFVQLVAEQRLEGVAVRAMADGYLLLPDDHAAMVRRLHVAAIGRVLQLDGLLIRATRALREAGVTVRVLKGAAFAHLLYDDPATRSYIDVDLLVPGAQFDTAAAVIRGLGGDRRYGQVRPGFDRRFSKGASFVLPGGLAIDLHRTLVVGPYGLSIDVASLFDEPTPFAVGGGTLDALSWPRMLVHAAVHASLGDWPPRIVPHRDLAALVTSGRVPLGTALDVADGWRATAPLARAMLTAWELFGLAEHPLHQWARGHRSTRGERRRLELYGEGRSSRRLALAAARAVPGTVGKLRYLRDLAVPDREYLAGRQRTYGHRWKEAAGDVIERWRGR